MSKIFSYSVLQHHYSSIIDEVINIGVLFTFPDDNVIKFQKGNINRVKCLYSDFDYVAISSIVENIENSVNTTYSHSLINDLFFNQDELTDIFLRPDDSSLQFTKPKRTVSPFIDIYKVVQEYSKLILPTNSTSEIQTEAHELRHNENYILRKYVNSVVKKNSRVEKMFRRNTEVKTNTVILKFEYGWKNKHTNLVKAVSLDLKESINIQNKGMQYYGYLTKLKDYAKSNNLRYDILVGKPQEEELIDAYYKAVENLNSADSYKKIITEETLEEYSEETYEYLTKELEESL